MARSAVLEAPRLRFEPFSDDWLSDRHVSWLNDPEVTRFSENRHRVHTMESCRAYAASYEGTPNYFWAIVACDAGLGHIGNINAYVDPIHSLADVGIILGERAAWGCGYGTEAWLAVCDYLLRQAGLRKVAAGTLSVNLPMVRIMRRSGMQPDGVRLAHYLQDDVPVDVVHYALFRDTWLVRHPHGPFALTQPR